MTMAEFDETPEPQDADIEEIPEEDEPLDEDDDLEDLEDDDPDALVLEAEPFSPLGRSWAFDFVEGRFVKTPNRGPLQTRGIETLRYWVEKCLRTERGAFPLHDGDYGIEDMSDPVGSLQSSDAAAELQGRVRDALTYHPRISDIAEFQTSFDPDSEVLEVSFRVIVDDDFDLTIQGFQLG